MITFHFPEKDLESELNENNSFGISTHVDVYDCDYHIIRDPHIIKKFVIELCDKIEMKTFGECLVKDFGEEERVKGISSFQFIETSSISGHFRNEINAAYICIFSCKYYNPRFVDEFVKNYFLGKSTITNVLLRK